jgi:nucleoside 2-deoxyribosyltransferase
VNIYFACSITGGREFEHIYQELIRALLADGHEIPTAHLAESNVVDLEAAASAREVYERDVIWLRNAEAVIAEVSIPSHGVGYEVGFALSAGKPVLCLYLEGRRVSKMISGNPHPKLAVKAYKNAEEAIESARAFLKKVK